MSARSTASGMMPFQRKIFISRPEEPIIVVELRRADDLECPGFLKPFVDMLPVLRHAAAEHEVYRERSDQPPDEASEDDRVVETGKRQRAVIRRGPSSR